MASPPVFKVPAAPAKKTQLSAKSVYTAYINAHPTMKTYSDAIQKAAHDYGLDPVYYASLLWKESFAAAKAQGKDPATIVSPTGHGVGIAQINPSVHVGDPIPWAPGQRVTREMLDNPQFSIRFGAYYFSKGVAQYGSYEQAYKNFYNPGYTGSVFEDVPKKYVPTTTASSPTDVAQRGAETKVAGAQLTPTTWAVLKHGKLKFVTTTARADGTPNVPKGAVRIWDQPLTKSDFLQQYSGIQDDFLAYTGKRPSFNQAASVLAHGWSQYQLRQHLVNDPGFTKSPVWKQNAPGYQDVYHQIYGPDATVNTAAIKYAIANNLGSAGFADLLRRPAAQRPATLKAVPDYSVSNEFKQKAVQNADVYRTIYGEPAPQDQQTITDSVWHGYDTNQFARYLRQQPQYKSSAEWQRLMYGLANKLGLIQGHDQTVLGSNTGIPQTPAPV